MKDLPAFLKSEKYKKIKFKFLKTQHLLIKAKVNGVLGNFILDTGASNTCVGLECIEKYNLEATYHSHTAASASSTSMFTKIAKDNSLQIGSWKQPSATLILFDLSHVNEALSQQKIKPVDGIIGADVLLSGKAIIDYPNQYLYLQ
ncbi:retropepsin-like aspartic protease [Flavobacterium difficile]|uniref:Clan AA aspartic protease n=1 Tax=Flavobacterium difficile TaxID=2709659 RepID=A0ABX0I6X5_9FLAO|nr:retropepsin-like aspartic protease [Flavobacterium difficile]NHM02933.1 clan AA aspartic protease [Flavobacterium difficile]